MTAQDIRWIQRCNHFTDALACLQDAVTLSKLRQLSRLEEQGLIQAFEFTHELAWNTLKDFLESRGALDLFGSRDTTRAAFKAGLIENGETWMAMIKSRNLTTHTYNQTVSSQIVAAILGAYFAEFEALRLRLAKLREENPT